MFPTLQIGPLSIQTPGLVLLLSLWLGLNQAEKHAHQRGIHPEALYNLVLYTLLAALLSARIVYALFYRESFQNQPLDLFSLNPAMLHPLGAILGGTLAALITIRRQKMDFWPTLDALTPLLMVITMGIASANIASGAAFGAETALPWPLSIELWGATRHPSQFYELLAAIAIYLTLMLRIHTSTNPQPGRFFWQFSALYSLAMVFLLGLRAEATPLPGGLRGEQVASWLILALSFWQLNRTPAFPQPNHG